MSIEDKPKPYTLPDDSDSEDSDNLSDQISSSCPTPQNVVAEKKIGYKPFKTKKMFRHRNINYQREQSLELVIEEEKESEY